EDPDFVQQLLDLEGNTDGHMDEVHDLRNQYGADMVAMINSNHDYCGIAFMGFGPHDYQMFSVTNYSCAVGNLSFAHELGHNMGAAHDKNQAGAGKYSYSHGHHFDNFRS